MSVMADLAYDIEQLYIDNYTADEIAQELGCPIGMVHGWLRELGVSSECPKIFSDF
jgi:uncharacterized protein YjcR|tara:strand:- start:1208 stop:1375 length:168 start_codon:yes stop_codon:yes gene_type:complete